MGRDATYPPPGQHQQRAHSYEPQEAHASSHRSSRLSKRTVLLLALAFLATACIGVAAYLYFGTTLLRNGDGSPAAPAAGTTPTSQFWSKVVLTQGDGKTYPAVGQTVTVHYVGTFTNGSVFDSSRARGKPFSVAIGMGKVIKGWDEGVPSMSLRERSNFTIQPSYAYGDNGVKGVIPPKSVLLFDIELLSIGS
ncbi:FK506 binding protein proline rotamase rapamycin-binding protein [Polyrhizophydium stewartii]|uniref:peptidylprolyl isomerase n=1 Tax=Polyrhizophydium stewartii TaxID=2732419 RepID=A0ABR4NI97_9FUNG